jgi:hypothetical protein
MRKELTYFNIDQSYGGNQDWFRDPIMKLGGCAAATACDSCIYLALHSNREHLYPYDYRKLDREAYVKFAMSMKPYLRPRLQGINKLSLYIEGFSQYLANVRENGIKLVEFSGEQSLDNAKAVIRQQLDHDRPIPYLLLRHKSWQMKDFVWHWFMVIGYEEQGDDFHVKIATYGNFHWLSLEELWNTGYSEKGGMVLYQ